EIYGYLLPFVQPVSGIMRLGTQKLMVQPAWKNMQQNVLRWFFRAYVNRLGTHLIELFSGRLSIGADQYRRLTRHASERRRWSAQDGPSAIVVAVTGARDAGKSSLIQALDLARSGDLHTVKLRLEQGGFDESLADHLRNAELVETDSFTIHEQEVARDRYTRKDAVADAVECDLLLLVVDGRRSEFSPESRFAEAWLNWYDKNHGLDIPPALVVMTGLDRPEMGADDVRTSASENATTTRVRLSKSAREAIIAKKVHSLRSALPPAFSDVIPVGLASPTQGIEDQLLPELAALLHRAERTALIRHLHRYSTRSKASRFFTQVGKQGRKVFQTVKSRRKAK
ncbi:MAG TPA: GTPase domain-containing protein, partial [Isosphaeraceae bacterium]|nr:GTPase domain-containing protein [Isosphaeraceae bacterium]